MLFWDFISKSQFEVKSSKYRRSLSSEEKQLQVHILKQRRVKKIAHASSVRQGCMQTAARAGDGAQSCAG